MAKSRSSTSKRPRGRPRTLDEDWAKVSVVLFERQIVDLDRCVTDIRRHNGNVLNRAGLIRALIDGFLSSPIERKTIRSEADLRTQVMRLLKSG